jgi:hypothetical protein
MIISSGYVMVTLFTKSASRGARKSPWLVLRFGDGAARGALDIGLLGFRARLDVAG